MQLHKHLEIRNWKNAFSSKVMEEQNIILWSLSPSRRDFNMLSPKLHSSQEAGNQPSYT